jgi:putative phage-type endonuclease
MTRQEWLSLRLGKIGGSDAACILGLNPFKTSVDMWREKVGLAKPEDISGKDVVQYGIKYEPVLIQSFAIDFPDIEIKHKDFDIEVNGERPWQVGSFDARLKYKDGRLGVFEAKTSQIQSRAQHDKWAYGVPDYYFCQVLHYLAVNPNFESVYLRALLKLVYLNPPALPGLVVITKSELKDYFWMRANLKDQIDYLIEKETEFVEKYLIPKKEPPLILPEI